MQPHGPGADPTIRSLISTVYVPSFLFAAGAGAVIPQVALTARSLGASVAVAGLAVALRGIGTMVFDVPSGALVARLGERKAMLVGTGLLIASLLGAVTAGSVIVFSFWMFLMGCGWAVWMLARLTYVSEVMPLHLRGRALSTMGGVQRMGTFVGPFVGAAAVAVAGFDGVYFVHLILAIAALGVILRIRDPHVTSTSGPGHPNLDVLGIARRHSTVFLTAGVGTIAIALLRTTRQVILPLWAEHIGLDAATVGVIFGISAAIDMVLFYPAGSVSDRFGRKMVAVPSIVIMAIAMALVPLSGGFWSLTGVALLMGFGNGLGSGIIMTLGADFAPPGYRAEFLGVWRLVGDVGSAAGPLVVSGLAAISLGAAALAVAGIGLAGAGLMAFRMPEPNLAARKRPAD
ncbi:MAG TPA: MFS transporter [Acidimicrobiia bacterium]|nr:MFS transporter [Acidimicrobiia bacterium]